MLMDRLACCRLCRANCKTANLDAIVNVSLGRWPRLQIRRRPKALFLPDKLPPEALGRNAKPTRRGWDFDRSNRTEKRGYFSFGQFLFAARPAAVLIAFKTFILDRPPSGARIPPPCHSKASECCRHRFS